MSQQSFINAKQAIGAHTNGTNDSFHSSKRFYDDVNFPKGFKRCGDFTSKEADLLEQHGQAMKNLAEGSQIPCNVDEDQFVQVSQGKLPASTAMELLWIKYCRLAKGKPFYAVVGTIHTPSSAKVEIEFDDIESDASDTDEAE
ncbi:MULTISPECIES: DUF413 domain-containing protein [Shewanella]|uniref:Macrodomain Ori protein n=1 Tax=Shewanella polaris TaxID=2588449 RepID=A0A4Y5YGB7_9GAMM|nr:MULTISPECIES: DUF413 domain-containing protein [Shewanella]QDE31655.1 DUF413 domain-containing protein [Shewanella polaris]